MEPAHELRPIRWYEYTVGVDEPALPGEPAVPPAEPGLSAYYFVQFKGPVDGEMKDSIAAAGGELLEYVPDDTYLVRMDEATVDQVAALPDVRRVVLYEPAMRLSTALLGLAQGEGYEIVRPPPQLVPEFRPELPGEPEMLELALQVFRGEDLEAVAAQVASAGGEVLASSSGRRRQKLRVRVPVEAIAGLAHIPAVLRVEEYLPPQLFNDTGRGVMHVDPVWTAHGLRGDGQVVGIADTGLDTGVNDQSLHPDVRGRVLQIFRLGTSIPDLNGHGTHVAGSVAGDGSASGGQYSGVAPRASLVFQSIASCNRPDGSVLDGIPADLYDLFQQAYGAGARIHTNSWGSPAGGAYTDSAYEADEFAWDHPEMLILFAAGNSGYDANQDNVVDANSVGSPGTAKNVLTVGASENDRPYIAQTYWSSVEWPIGAVLDHDRVADHPGGLAAFSSRGPTDDGVVGRIKPDLVAPGTMVASLRSQGAANTVHVADDMEGGPGAWAADAPWGLVAGVARSGTLCWHSNPGGTYAANADVSLQSPAVNLSGGGDETKALQFWCRYDLPDPGDRWRVQVSPDGQTWYGSLALAFTGTQDNWELVSIGLGQFSWEPALRFRFRLQADGDADTGAGLFIDDVRIVEGAFGTSLLSDHGLTAAGSPDDQQYLLMSGTSMATPLTAGAAALVRQYYTQVRGLPAPSAALLRATLIHGAAELSPGQYGPGVEMGPKPNIHEGWGRVDLNNSLFPPAPLRLDCVDAVDGLATGDAHEFYLRVEDTSAPLAVTMVYHDYPGRGLTNRLELSVLPPGDAEPVHPNGRNSADTDNNVQQIVIPEPERGTYAIRVVGRRVPEGPQRYALVTTAVSTLRDWPEIDVSPDRVAFGNVRLGSSKTERVTFSNPGQQPLEIREMALDDTDHFRLLPYHVVGEPSYACGSTTPTIPPRGSCSVAIRFQPLARHAYAALLTVRSNDPYRGEATVPLTGSAAEVRQPNIVVGPTDIDFGEMPVGETAKPRFVAITNVGTATLHARVAPIADLSFSCRTGGLNPCPSLTPSIDPGRQCSVSVTFHPQARGTYTTVLQVVSDDPDTPVAEVRLHGTGA